MIVGLMTVPADHDVTAADQKRAEGAASRTRGRREPARIDGQEATLSGVAFEALLTVARSSASVDRGGGAEYASAVQMFEPPAADGRSPRSGAAQREGPAPVDTPATSSRYDGTSVEARRQSDASRTGGAASPSADASRVVRGEPFLMARSATSGATPSGDAGDASGQTALRLSPSVLQAKASGAAPPTAPWTQGSRAAGPGAPKASGPASGVSPAPSLSARGTQSPSPALRLGQILGADRASGVEAGRAVTSPSNPAAMNRQSAARSDNKMSPQGRPSGTGDAGSAASSSKSGAAAEPSPFDALVRSIRLNTGSVRSSARIQLQPPELGRIDVRLQVTGDAVIIQVDTETPEASRLLKKRAAVLTAALARHGVAVERFDIDILPAATGFVADSGGAAANRTGEDDGRRGVGAAPATARDVPDDEGTASSQTEPQDAVVTATRLDIRV